MKALLFDDQRQKVTSDSGLALRRDINTTKQLNNSVKLSMRLIPSECTASI